MGEIVRHGTEWGLILSAYLTVGFVGLLWINAEMWLNDYPPDIQAKHGPIGPSARRQRWVLGVPVLAGALAIITAGTLTIPAPSGGAPRFVEVFLHTAVMLMVFNIVDLVVIDWLLLIRIRPGFVVLPGTEGSAGYDDHAFHWRAFLKGTAGIAVMSAGIAALLAGFG